MNDQNSNNSRVLPWMIVTSYSLLGICFPAAVTQFSILTPEMAAALGTETRVVLLADSLRAVCLVTALFLSGLVCRRIGRLRTICLGLAMQVLPQFLIPLALEIRSIPLFFVVKSMQGFNAVAFPVYLSTISACVSPRSTGLATALFNGSFTAGAGFGAWFSGSLVQYLGIGWTFRSLGLLCLILAVPALLLSAQLSIPGDGTRPAIPMLGENRRNTGYTAIMRKPVLWLLILMLSANTWVMQSITVDMPVYLDFIGITKSLAGSLMLAGSMVTILASVLAGGVSDFFAARFRSPIRTRTIILAGGYAISAIAAVLFALGSGTNFGLLAVFSCAMIFGASWAGGVFWALPSQLFSKEENLTATAICSGASNLVNPLAPFVTGFVLGGSGHWTSGWLCCGLVPLISMTAALILRQFRTPKES